MPASACRRPPTAEAEGAGAGLFTDGAGTVLMDGLLELDDRFFKKADDRWPVFVIFTSDGTESQHRVAREGVPEVDAAARSARHHRPRARAARRRKGSGHRPEIVAENLTHNTGGRYDVMNTTTALPEKMKALGEKLALDHRNMSSVVRGRHPDRRDRASPPVEVAVTARRRQAADLVDRRGQ